MVGVSLDELARGISKEDEPSFDKVTFDDSSRECGDDGDGGEKGSKQAGATLFGAFRAAARAASRAAQCWSSNVAPCGPSRGSPMVESLAGSFAGPLVAAENSTLCG